MTHRLLGQATRGQFATLLDAITFASPQEEALAIIYLETGQEPVTVSQSAFRQRALQSAAALQALGIAPRQIVIIAHTQNLESMILFWAALHIGAIPSMFPTLTEKLDPDIYMQGMAQLVRQTQAAAILTTDEFAPTLASIAACPTFGSSRIAAAAGSLTMYPAEPGEVAFLQHSSGTTGLQKGVALSHTAVLNQVAAYSDVLALRPDDVIVSWLPLYHDMGLIAGFLLPLIQGIPLVLMSPFDWARHPALLLHAIDRYKGTLCWLPNFAYNHCARRIRRRDSESLSLLSMRAFINCSEPVHHESHLQFCERFAANGVTFDRLSVSYAMAENTFAVTQTLLGKPATLDSIDRVALQEQQIARPLDPAEPTAQTVVSCGPPIPGVEVAVLGSAGEHLAARQVGEMAVRSSFMLTGYHNRPDLNERLWQDGWYRTGDMGYIAGGEVYIIGRQKDIIINAGKNVYPQDIEAIVNTVAGVYPGRAVAFGVYDEREGTELIGVVAETDPSAGADRTEIAQTIRQRVAQQSTISVSYVHLVDERWLIKTSSGKIARAANRDKWLEETNGKR